MGKFEQKVYSSFPYKAVHSIMAKSRKIIIKIASSKMYTVHVCVCVCKGGGGCEIGN